MGSSSKIKRTWYPLSAVKSMAPRATALHHRRHQGVLIPASRAAARGVRFCGASLPWDQRTVSISMPISSRRHVRSAVTARHTSHASSVSRNANKMHNVHKIHNVHQPILTERDRAAAAAQAFRGVSLGNPGPGSGRGGYCRSASRPCRFSHAACFSRFRRSISGNSSFSKCSI
jgi:hypothetical protein